MTMFTDYKPLGFDEAVGEDGLRPHYRALAERLDLMGPTAMAERVAMLESMFRRQGITFAVYGSEEGTERTWPMDLFPRIITAVEWAAVERGLEQRMKALNAFLDDLYVGEQSMIEEGLIPRWLVESSDGYIPEVLGIKVPPGSRCSVGGIDLIRDGEGTYRVLEDNLRVPSGVSYVLENRVAMTRVLPVGFSQYRVRSVGHYGVSLLQTLQASAPRGVSDPTVVVLTPGIFNSAYFEHAFLARQMGVELVEGRDLVVQDKSVYMRTTHGLKAVDVIYRRIDDHFIDPEVFREDSVLGVAGLMSVIRAGRVSMANAVGNGVADDKAIYPYVPAMIEYYLGEKAILPNVQTYLPWEEDQRKVVLDRINELVIKPVAEAGGKGIVMGHQASDAELAKAVADVTANPRGFIAQEVVQLSTSPTFDGDGFEGRHIDLRPFILSSPKGIEILPGGLTRVAASGSLIVNSSAGGGSKDTWVLEDVPIGFAHQVKSPSQSQSQSQGGQGQQQTMTPPAGSSDEVVEMATAAENSTDDAAADRATS